MRKKLLNNKSFLSKYLSISRNILYERVFLSVTTHLFITFTLIENLLKDKLCFAKITFFSNHFNKNLDQFQ
jgi:hypothetical protein